MSRIFSLANDASITSMRCSQFHSPSRPSPITSCFKTPKTETARGFRGDFTNQWRHSGYVHLFFFFFTVCSRDRWDRFQPPPRNPKLDKWLRTWMDGQRSDKQTAVRIKVEWVWCVETVWDCGKTWFCFLLSTIEEFIWRVHCNTCTAVQRMFVLPCAAASSLSDLACSNHRFYNKTWEKT